MHFPQEEILAEDSAEADGVVPTDSQDGAEASQDLIRVNIIFRSEKGKSN